MADLDRVAPAFVDMAHRIVWASVATVDRSGAPRTRVLHPIWEFDGGQLTGWIATSPNSLKAKHLARTPQVSITYWAPNHDTCTADGVAAWETSDAERRAGWDRFLDGPEPVGYDPRIIPQWTSPTAPEFGVLRITPSALRVMPGSLPLEGTGELLSWRRPG